MTIGSLFSGIGGFELGLMRGIPGARVAWQVEIDPWCRDLLARRFPGAERLDDVCGVGARNLAPVDVLCGGFPCQDISCAGRGEGLDGARSGLWFQMLRVIEETRPAYVVAENVGALRTRGLPVVLDGLARAGYLATWSIISAGDIGAPHERRRLWVLACRRDVPQIIIPHVDRIRDDVWPRGGDPEPWERGIARTHAHAITGRPARLKGLGNAVVPQIPEMIGRAIAAGESFSLTGRAHAPAPTLPTVTVAERDNAGGENPGPVRACLTNMARRGEWPTPRASMGAGGHTGRGAIDSLHSAVKAWPTPCASDNRDRGHIEIHASVQRRARIGKQIGLSQVASDSYRVWHTPCAHMAKEGGYPAEYLRATPLLTAQAIGDPERRGKLNPEWVELLMGYEPGWTE